MNRFINIIFSFLIAHTLSAQYTVSPSTIKWYDIDQAHELNKKAPRPILIDLYTNDCSWCEHMMKTTFANHGIANYINNNFYAVRFNAESTDTVEFQGRKYFNRKVGRKPTHDLASILLNGNLSYPSIVYFDRNGKKTIISGFKEPKDIEPTLAYIVENLSGYVSLSEYTANFMFTYPAAFEKDHSIFKIPREIKPDTLGIPNWIEPTKINIQNKKKRRPFIVFFYSNEYISSKVMEKTTFGNKKISELLNKNFRVVKFDARSQNTITFLGKQYSGTGKGKTHQLTNSLLQNNVQMPAVAFFDERGKPITKFNGYLNVKNLEKMLHFYNEKKYETISYNEYLKSLKTSNSGTNSSMN